jgi:hypothetical protein
LAGENDLGQGEGTAEVEGGQAPPEATGGDNLNPFLERVDPAHREVVEPYLKQWDANATRRFQEIHSTYDPYKFLVDNQVDPQIVNNSLSLYSLLETDPEKLYYLLQQEAQVHGWGQQQGQPGSQYVEDQYQGLPTQFVSEFQGLQQQNAQMLQALQAVGGWINAQQTTTQEQQEDQELDRTLGLMRQEYGDFDEQYILAQMSTGASPEQAMQAYQGLVQGLLQQQEQSGGGRGRFAPRVMGSGGVVPMEGTDVKKASGQEVTDLVASVLAQSNQAKR